MSPPEAHVLPGCQNGNEHRQLEKKLHGPSDSFTKASLDMYCYSCVETKGAASDKHQAPVLCRHKNRMSIVSISRQCCQQPQKRASAASALPAMMISSQLRNRMSIMSISHQGSAGNLRTE
jgi:hypothetical protein